MGCQWWTGFERIAARVDVMTGEKIEISPPIDLHHEDADWFFNSWAEVDRLGYEVRLAVAQEAA